MLEISKAVLVRIALAGIAVGWGACGTEEGNSLEDHFSAETGGEVDTSFTPRVVSSIKTVDGASVTFLDESEPGQEPSIGVEISNSLKTPVTDALLEQEPTALELYLALAPAGQGTPAALVRDHSLVRGAAEPRRLAAAAVDVESSGVYDCANSAGWRAAFQAWAPVLDGQYIGTNELGSTTGYVGYAPKFYFDVCRPWDPVRISYYTGVQRRVNSAGTWTTINSNTNALNYPQRRWRYYHNTPTCSSYQYRLVVSGNWYHRAARWADEWSCGITTGS